ncbi:hypothetical protein V2G26_017328 [Clonostachys chloroleuca]
MENDVQDLVRKLATYFQSMRRGPYAQEAFQEATKDPNSFEGILLGESQQALLAYLAAKKAVTRGPRGGLGGASMQRRIDGLSKASPEDQRAFAKQLSSQLEEVQKDAGPLTEGTNTSIEKATTKRRRVDNPAASTSVESDLEHGNPERMPSEESIFIGAPLKLANDLFQDELWDSIGRMWDAQLERCVANISMIFLPTSGYQMNIGITQGRVAELANEFFGAKVEDKDGVRCVRYPGGVKIVPDHRIKLLGSRRDTSTLFKDMMHQALEASHTFQLEESEVGGER